MGAETVRRLSWPEATTRLVDVAMGRQPADLVIRNGRWLNVYSGEIIPGTDVAVVASRIAYCGPNAGRCIGPQTRVIAAEGRHLVPGLLDAHTHVEVTMLTATEFVRAVIPHGTTGMFVDPHEIANVFGLRGLRMMLDEIATLPINVYVQVPSGVPSVPGLETSGATLGPGEVAEALSWPGVVGLAEDGRPTVDMPAYKGYPPDAQQSVHLKQPLREEDFLISAPLGSGDSVRAHVIGLEERSAVTRHLQLDLPVKTGQVLADPEQDVAHAALVERHKGTGAVTNAFIHGFNFGRNCTAASTVSHDSHHLVVVGTSPAEMALATQALAEAGGGMTVFKKGERLSLVNLPIAGLMSTEPAEIVAKELAQLQAAFETCGCRLSYAYKQLSMLALVSIPELRLSNLGLVDVERFALIPPLEQKNRP